MATEDAPNPTNGSGIRRLRVDGTGFVRVGRRAGLWTYLKQVWDFRHFIIFDSKSRIAGESSDDSLGRIWMVLNPVLQGAAYFVVFGIMLNTSRGIENFIAYLIIGIFMFRFTAASIVAGSRAISGNRALVTAFSFPRMTLPIAINVREMMRNMTTYATMFALILIIPPLEPITWKWLAFIPILGLQFLFNLGLSFVLARIVADWNDFTHILAFGTRMWLYLSAVFYSTDRFADMPLILNIMNANPLFNVLDMSRDVILYDAWPEPMRWLILGGWTVGLLIIGTLMFWQGEEKYGRER